ncbi:transcription factor [Colletotrichum sojae]|uniref:Transcription factor n=1 Tax=Colletotrichum sojae TaxID=2175907 RepID=A0A8H6MYK7_9PEZI|nr:transcription factor [Colletotrichum sojae]
MIDMGRRWPTYHHHLGEQDWCRRRKQKCDLKSPKCSNCDEAKVPRNYVSSLEAKVAELTKELEQLRQPQTHPIDDTPSSRGSSQASPVESATSPSEYQNWMTSNLGRVVCEPANQPHFFGVSSGITLARLVMSAIRVNDLPPSLPTRMSQQAGECSYSAATQATLPPRQAAEHLFDVYFQNRTPNFPIVSRSRAKKALDGAYDTADNSVSSSGCSPMDAFITYMILAIALCSVRHPSGGRPPESENCFLAAVGVVEKVFVRSGSDTESLRAILLLSQYIALRPPKGNLWLLSGMALRLAVDLGMHWETEESKLRMDSETLNDRRRLWYSAYLFDRLLCITLGRPFGMADQGINVGLPVPPEELNCALWIEDIKARLQAWRDSIQPPSEAHTSSIFGSQAYWDAIYSEALLLLYRPNPVQPQPSLEGLQVSLESSRRLIDSIKTLHRERRIDIMWKELRESADIKTSVATLSALAERWDGAAGCRDAFEALSDVTVSWLIATNVEEARPSCLRFERQVEGFHQQLPPALAQDGFESDPLAILSSGGFGFGETLCSAAEWPTGEGDGADNSGYDVVWN